MDLFLNAGGLITVIDVNNNNKKKLSKEEENESLNKKTYFEESCLVSCISKAVEPFFFFLCVIGRCFVQEI